MDRTAVMEDIWLNPDVFGIFMCASFYRRLETDFALNQRSIVD
jgi:hypothetical protein